jgi:hypothetical protein
MSQPKPSGSGPSFFTAVDCAMRDHYRRLRHDMRQHALMWKSARNRYPSTAAFSLEQAIWYRSQSKPFAGHMAAVRVGVGAHHGR